MTQAVPGLEVARVQTDADLDVMIAVRSAADPDRPPPRLENLRHNLAANETLVYVIALLGGKPAGCGFVDPWPDDHARGHLVVVPALRRRGVGAALLAELGHRAVQAGRPELEGEVVESNVDSQD
jgi:GNAT superfamily N-acetyltransferase